MIRKMFSSLIPDSLKQEFKIKLGGAHMYWSIANLKKNGLNTRQILDIGAYKGEWTEEVLKIFPHASYLMIEANGERKDDLTYFVSKHTTADIKFEIALLGRISGEEKLFHVMDTASSVLDEHVNNNMGTVALTTQTLDEVVKKNHFNDISLIKLDVQGYEIEILKGGRQTMSTAEAVLMEVSLLDIHKNVPLMRDVLNFMYEHQFVAYDICSVSARRPRDRALWQTDIIFVKENSKYRSNKSYY